jgi:hypothetical protein
MRSIFMMLCVVVLFTTIAGSAVNYEYHDMYNVTSDVAKCQKGAPFAFGTGGLTTSGPNGDGCHMECRGVAVDGMCVCRL